MKEQIKTPEKELNEMEISNQKLKSERNQSEMKDTLIEMKNNLQGNNSRMDEAKNQINALEHRKQKTATCKKKKKEF